MTYVLPEPTVPATKLDIPKVGAAGPLYSTDQVQEAYTAGRLAGLEEAAKFSEDTVTALAGLEGMGPLIHLGDDIADNIRKLKETK